MHYNSQNKYCINDPYSICITQVAAVNELMIYVKIHEKGLFLLHEAFCIFEVLENM